MQIYQHKIDRITIISYNYEYTHNILLFLMLYIHILSDNNMTPSFQYYLQTEISRLLFHISSMDILEGR